MTVEVIYKGQVDDIYENVLDIKKTDAGVKITWVDDDRTLRKSEVELDDQTTLNVECR